MTTLTIKIDEHSKKGKAFLEFANSFFKEGKEVEIVESVSKKRKKEDESQYNPEFVKMVLDAEKRGNYTTLDPNDIWGSLGLK